MLQEFNPKLKANVSLTSPERDMSELAWWRTWTSSWWANVYF